MTWLFAFSPSIAAVLFLICYMIYKAITDRKKLKGNLSIGGPRPIFSDVNNNKFYNIHCKCGNHFSVGTLEVDVKCDKCGSYDKLSYIWQNFYINLGK